MLLEMSTICRFPPTYNSEGITSPISTEGRSVVNNGQNLINVVKERPPNDKNIWVCGVEHLTIDQKFLRKTIKVSSKVDFT